MLQHDAVRAVLDTVLVHTPAELEGQHALLHALISALCLQLVRVQAQLSARAPVSRLPDDILTQIFTYAVHPTSVYAATSPVAVAIAGTNRRWRTLASGHPALWTRVDLRHPSAPYALAHSRRLGLEVRLDAPLWKDARDAPLARTLAPHVSRVKQLWIQTASVHTEAFLKSIVAKSSQLERLVVTGRYTDDHALQLPSSLLPRLRHLSLTHAFLAPAPVPTNLLSLSLKPPPGAPPLALSALASLLQGSPNLTDLSLFGNAVPVYKPGEPQHDRTDLIKLKTLKVAGVNPVQAAWLLFHISYPSGTLLTLDLEPSRPLRTLPFDRPRAPDFTRPRAPGELESYYAVLTMFRSGAISLDTVTIGPAVSESKQLEAKPVEKQVEQEEEIITEKLAAQYTSTTSTLSLSAGSRATEAVARLFSTPVPSVSKLCITGVKLGLERLEQVKRGNQEECQIRTLEIRACSLPVPQKGERRANEERTLKSAPPPTPSQTSPTSGPNINFSNAPNNHSTAPNNHSNALNNHSTTASPPNNFLTPHPSYSNPYSSTGFPTPSSSGHPTPNPPNVHFPIWTPYTTSHELTTPTSAGTMPFYAGGRFVHAVHASGVNASGSGLNGVNGGSGGFGGTGSNGDTLNSPASSEDDTATTDTAVPDETDGPSRDLNLSSSFRSASGDTTLASIASSEDANVSDVEDANVSNEGVNAAGDADANAAGDEGANAAGEDANNASDDAGSEISDTDAVVNLNASEKVGERRKSLLASKARPGKLRDEVAKLRDEDQVRAVVGQDDKARLGAREDDKTRFGAREDDKTRLGARQDDKMRTGEGSGKGASDKNVGGGSSTAGTVGTGSGSGTSTPLLFGTPPTAQVRGLSNGAQAMSGAQVNGTSSIQANGINGGVQVNGAQINNPTSSVQVNGVKPPLPSAISAPLLSTTNLPQVPNPNPQPQLSRVATAPQLDQLRLRSNFLRPSNSSSNLRRPLGFAPYATSVAVTGFGTEPSKPSRSPTFPFPNPNPSFHTLRQDDPDIRLLTILSFHMPQLEELRIVRSTIRGGALIKFIESRNNCVDDESDSDSDGGRAGPGTPILMLELVECPYVSAEHVRVLRENVDDVRWKAYTYVGGAGGV